MADAISTPSGNCETRVRLTGRVAGVESCEVVAGSDEVLVGSGVSNDLVVCDPLVPPRAFKLVRHERHCRGSTDACNIVWMLEALPGARVFLNDRFTRRDQVTFGDRITVGCHQIIFTGADADMRNRRANVNVTDLCADLMRAYGLPHGFLNTCPSYAHRQRLRKAFTSIGVMLVAMLALVLLVPRQPYFDPIQPPMEVEFAKNALPPEAVRSLDQVARQNFDTQDPTMDKADLVAAKPAIDHFAPAPMVRDQPAAAPAAPPTLSGAMPDAPAMPARPVVADAPENVEIRRDAVKLAAAAPAAKRTVADADASTARPVLAARSEKAGEVDAPVLTSTKEDALPAPAEVKLASAAPNWKQPAMKPASIEVKGPDVTREVMKLASATPPVRRLSVQEAAQRAAEKSDLAGYRVKMDQGLAGTVTARTTDQNIAANLGKPTADTLSVDRAAYLQQLSAYKASPVQFEEFKGMQVPVARIAEQLAQLEPKDQSKGNSLVADGMVSAEEIQACWKSGRFKMHATGNPPPEADPATYCYVGKNETDGKPCLYISFVCVDPDVSKIKAAGSSGVARNLILDDSIEVFLDVNNDRKDYVQLVVNAKGDYWAGYWPTPMSDGGKAIDWNCAATIKSTINKSGNQWSCEITIPFDKLGGAPAKGTRWAVNFCRNFRGQQDDWQLQSWFAVYDKNRNFHHPSLFGIFQW